MFKHILVPTDGSAASDVAVVTAMRLARSLGAKVTGVHVIAPFRVLSYKPEMLQDTAEQYDKDSKAQAVRLLLAIEKSAREFDVQCDTVYVRAEDIDDAIIRTAIDQHCDLIVMASHGRKGIGRLLLGSETQKVITHCKIPVMVVH